MNRRKINKIDNLIKGDVDYDKFVFLIVYIFFDFLKLLYNDISFDILRNYISMSPNISVDEIVYKCNISFSTYYRKIEDIELLIEEVSYRKDDLFNDFYNLLINGNKDDEFIK